MYYNKGLIDKDYCKSTSLKTEKKNHAHFRFSNTFPVYILWNGGKLDPLDWAYGISFYIHFRFELRIFVINQNANQNILTKIKNDTYFLD